MYVCQLTSASLTYPHVSETAILRRLMPVDSSVRVSFQRPKRPHMKVDICLKTGESVTEELEKMYVS